MTKKFAKSDDVVFGDVVLQKTPIRAIHGQDVGAGQGGWPTIRYYNKETGYAGAKYPKRFDGMAMCDELGNFQYMQEYVEHYGGASSCSVATLQGCKDEEKTLIEKFKGKGDGVINQEIASFTQASSKDEASITKLQSQVEEATAEIKRLQANVKQLDSNQKILNKIMSAASKQEL